MSHSFEHISSDFSKFQSSLLFPIFWLQKIEKKLSKTVIKPSLGIWDIPYTALSGATYILGNQCIASLGSSSTVSFISSNVWNTRTNKAFKKWQRKFYYNVCLVLFFSSTASKNLLGLKKRMGKMPISILVNEKFLELKFCNRSPNTKIRDFCLFTQKQGAEFFYIS